MEIISAYEDMYKKYKELNYMTPQKIYFDDKYDRLIYIIRLYDYAKRNYQKRKYGGASSWIYIYDGNIANHIKLTTLQYRKLLKSFGAKYNRENGVYFNSQEECEIAINKLYDYLFKNQIVELGDKYENR